MGIWTVAESSADSSIEVPMKSKERQAHASFSSQLIRLCCRDIMVIQQYTGNQQQGNRDKLNYYGSIALSTIGFWTNMCKKYVHYGSIALSTLCQHWFEHRLAAGLTCVEHNVCIPGIVGIIGIAAWT